MSKDIETIARTNVQPPASSGDSGRQFEVTTLAEGEDLLCRMCVRSGTQELLSQVVRGNDGDDIIRFCDEVAEQFELPLTSVEQRVAELVTRERQRGLAGGAEGAGLRQGCG